MLRFSKAKCLCRLKETGHFEHLSKEDRKILDSLNGQPVARTVFSNHILFEEFVYALGKDGIGYYVRLEDCTENENLLRNNNA